MNAGTDRELTVYYAKVARPHFDRAADVLTDMVRNAARRAGGTGEGAQGRHRGAGLRRRLAGAARGCAAGRDDVARAAARAGRRRHGGVRDGPHARPTVDYMRRQYVPNNMVVVGRGRDRARRDCRRSSTRPSATWRRATPSAWIRAVNGQGEPRARRAVQADGAGAHRDGRARLLAASTRTASRLDLISVILGEGMSSRLFLELREKRALCYDVHSYASHYLDAGSFAVYAGVDPSKAAEAVGGAAAGAGEGCGTTASRRRSCTRRRSCRRAACCCAWRTRATSPAGWAGRRCSTATSRRRTRSSRWWTAVTMDDVKRVAQRDHDEEPALCRRRRAVQVRQALSGAGGSVAGQQSASAVS